MKLPRLLIFGRVYMFPLMDFYAASGLSLFWCTFFQTIAIYLIFWAKKNVNCIEHFFGPKNPKNGNFLEECAP